MKKLVALLLVLSIVFGDSAFVYAAEAGEQQEIETNTTEAVPEVNVYEKEGVLYSLETDANEAYIRVKEIVYEGVSVVIIPQEIQVEGVVYPVKEIAEGAFSNNIVISAVVIPDSVSHISDNIFHESNAPTIYCNQGSVAEQYCVENNIAYSANLFDVILGKDRLAVGESTEIEIRSILADESQIAGVLYEEFASSTENIVTIEGNQALAIESGSGILKVNFCGITRSLNIEVEPRSEENESAVLATASANTEFEYTISDSGATITKYTGTASVVEIPAVLEGVNVTIIGSMAFKGNQTITSVKIPNTVVKISEGAFGNCSELSQVKLSKSLTEMGAHAFFNCDKLTTIEIPKSLQKTYKAFIVEFARDYQKGPFYDCDGLKNVTFELGTTTIANGLFANCSGLEMITIPDTVTEIGDDAFSLCSKLKSVIFGKNVKSIGSLAFKSCQLLTSVAIPDTVVKISEGAFGNCSELSQVKLSKSLTEMGAHAFFNCDKLTAIEIPKSLQKTYEAFIVEFARNYQKGPFYDCDGLKNVTFESGTTTIANGLFANCSGLEMITIPDTVTEIGDDVFSLCSKLKSVTFGKNVKSIGSLAFKSCQLLTSVAIPDTVVKISEGAFGNCSELSQVKLSKSLTEMGAHAFFNCDKLTTIEIPKSLQKTYNAFFPEFAYGYKNGPFYGCDGLKNVTFESGTTTIANGLFANCTGLEMITIPDTILNIKEGAFGNCSKLSQVKLSNSLIEIGAFAFFNCDNLTNIEIPKSLQKTYEASVNEFAWRKHGPFYGCDGLKKVTFEQGTTIIANSLFANCHGLETIVIPDTVLNIKEGAFGNCSELTQVKLSNSMIEIGNYAFSNCDKLTAIEIPKSLEKTNSIYISEFASGFKDGPFLECDGLTNVSFEAGTKTIAKGLFANCYGLERITIPNTVTNIGSNSFEGCKKLKAVVCDAKKLDIDKNVFSNNASDFTIYTSKYSDMAIYAIDKEIPLVINSDKDYPDTGVLSYSESSYQMLNLSNSKYVSFNLKYKASSLGTGDAKIKIRLSKNTSLANGTIKINNKVVEDYEYSDSTKMLYIPIAEKEGSITLSINALTNGNILSYAVLDYKEDGKTKTNVIDIVSTKYSALTLHVDDVTSTAKFRVSGVASSGENVKLEVEEGSSIVVTAKADGTYTGELEIAEPKEYKQYNVKASSEADPEKIASSMISYSAKTPRLTEFKLFYNKHRDAEFDLLNNSSYNTVMEFNPAYKFTFNIKFDNGAELKDVYVVSEKNGMKKTMATTWNEATGSYIASGWFDEENHNYVPGVFSVEYTTEKKTIPTSEEYDIEKEGIVDALSEFAEYITITPLEEEEPVVKARILGSTQTREAYRITINKDLPGSNLSEDCILDSISETYDLYGEMNEWKEFLEGYTILTKQEGVLATDGKKYDVYTATDPLEMQLLTFVRDITDNKLVKSIIELGASGSLPIGDQLWWDNIGTFLGPINQVVSAAVEGYEIVSDHDAIERQINGANITPWERQELHKQNDALSKDRETFTAVLLVMGISMFALTLASPVGGYAAMTMAPKVMSAMLTVMAAMSKSFFDYRLGNLMAGKTPKLKWLIDPSGYVYEAFEKNRLTGVKATIYYRESEDGPVELWNAEEYSQRNPLYTDAEGKYAWDVPEGQWQVKYEKEGYEVAYSSWLDVPPPQLDVNVGLVALEAPKITWIKATTNCVEVNFSQYMRMNSLQEGQIEIHDNEGKKVPYKLFAPEVQVDAKGFPLANTVLLYLESQLSNERDYTLSLGDGVQSYSGKTTQKESWPLTFEEEAKLKTVKDTVYLTPGEEKKIAISVLEGENLSHLEVKSDNELIQVDSIIEILNKTAVVTVKADNVASGQVEVRVPNTSVVLQINIVALLNKEKEDDGQEVISTNMQDRTENEYSKKESVIEGMRNYRLTYGEDGFTLDTILAKGDGALSFYSSNENVVTVDESGFVAITGIGEAIINVVSAETEIYRRGYLEIAIQVSSDKCVNFDGNGGITSVATKTFIPGSAYGELPTATRTGYFFEGWYTSKTEGTKVESETIATNENTHTLYAYWTANSYTVSFNGNGGSIGTESKMVTYDSIYGELPTPTKAGYTFKGWYTSKTGDKKITSDSKVTITKNQNLYAQWSLVYTVTFNPNGGTVETKTKEVTKDSTYGALPIPVKSGYYFKGWYTSKTGNTKVTETTKVTLTKNQNLYAQWLPQYTVTFNPNGGTVATSTKEVAKGLTYGTLPTPTRSGYTFKGWYTSKTGDNKVTAKTQVTLTKNQNLYAQWIAKDFTVTFNPNGGTVETSDKIVTYASTYGTLPTPARSGYAFKGWYTSKTGDNKVTDATKVTITKNQNLYAQWTAKSFTVTFNANGGAVSISNKKVTYASTYGTLPTPTKSGYYFKGWYTSKTGDTQVKEGTKVTIAKNQNLFAQWTPAYTVTFNANGGIVSVPTKEVGQGLIYGNLPIPTRNGYTFKGWYTSKTGTNQISETTIVTISKNQNLYAQWEKL
ncbi:putative repeat protein (TIGR02543 family) [Lachnospiraceae bacterium PM6-15]|uniref:leucine-rich repeat protein n=1 Tax=Ohessyouella blattaphilus TaxID=2949333 RepID=UPI003E29C173